ncbi:RNA polymerase, sigma 28 subunit, SigD/FliA/WhiG [Marinobacter zhejiangensis]|uniref:RNA polymerase sigma factor FliA n=1 Tax=Marinobacter zhejiangensis TaxID=488535 RepID=A0A1I4NPX1_9GAMM|nr:RNA polymerase sigma factor FliA [Marinobacter zhejiangensis]SFM17405.1 RNA polymerase, sigma 28 subunit, SigD/FliA/WhiG [Marinobacter zhejiangensis]
MARNLGIYQRTAATQAHELVETHAPLVKKIALHLLARLPDSVQLDDLMQAGMIGLLEAAQKYQANKGASFETYAGIRIRGAIVDEIRKGDWVPRSVHRNARRVSEAIRVVESREGREAQDTEVADELGMTLGEYHACLSDASSGRLFSLDELTESGEAPLEESDGSDNPLQGITSHAFRTNLAQAIDELPEREKLVLSLYYQEELNLKEIGAVLDVSESRVSQIHSQAAMRLRARLSEWQMSDNGH